MSAPVTLGAALERAARALAAAGIEAPRRDARVLLGAATGLDRAALIADPDAEIGRDAAARFADLVGRRARREPVSHLLGRREFWSRDFLVGPDVLDPRPDSETLVATALELIAEDAAPAVLDLGVGSGCLLLSVLAERPAARGVGTDLSPAAVRMARENAARLGLSARAAFCVGDWGAALAGRFDLILCNPPYVARGAIGGLAPEVALHEPALALDGGEDGLSAYRAIAGELGRLLARGGIAIVEAGAGQLTDIKDIFESSGIIFRDRRDDLGGVPRCAVFGAPAS